ncbi:MAG: lipoprotein [Succinivibrionaceae bacterium]|nr:lipoprotein [Succinivibrionaceae bacterium]
MRMPLLSCLAAALLLSACGLKGPLYMPDDPSRGRKPVSSERLDADSRQAAAEAGLEGGQTAEGAGPVAAHDSEP